jgi:Effector-associated domain 1/Trypsin-like peptidase domain
MALDLKGKQLERFSKALISAFPDYGQIERMVRFELDAKLKDISQPQPLPHVSFELVSWAEAKSRLDDLLRGALEQNGTNEQLRRFAQEIVLTSDGEPSATLATRFQVAVLGGVGFHDVASWREKMAAAERCVCRIVGPLGTSGTGFLIGPRTVMTNAHVVEGMRGKRAEVQFDYKLDARGSSMNARTVMIGDVTPVIESPAVELDYAILELPEPVGAEAATPGGSARGHLRPSSDAIFERVPLFILQHPEGDMLKVCVGAAVRGANPEPRRVYYEVNTLGGSSGSPVFTLKWDLVALHHASDEKANRGVPMKEIVGDVRGRGFGHLLGE